MASRRAAHARMRRGGQPAMPSQPHARRTAHTQIRQGGIIRQENESSMEGPDDSRQAQQPAKAWKARRPS
jgi:hypothetical protein